MQAPRFVPLSLEEFVKLVERFDFSTRRIDEVHMHHTWRPSHKDFRGLASIIGMWKFHTEVNKWSDIAQHVTIDPDGTIWTGRSWKLPPASSSGHNGSALCGPFMFEMVGDFDANRDVLRYKQHDAVIGVIAAVQRKNGLAPNTLRFHRQLGSPKTCPGNGLKYEDVIAAVTAAHEALARGAAPKKGKRAVAASTETFVVDETRLREALDVASSAARGFDGEDAGMDASEGTLGLAAVVARDGGLVERAPGSRDANADLDASALAHLRPHVVNLVQGEFIPTGIYQSSREDVDAIFGEHLPPLVAAATPNKPLRLMLWAHGGLVSERSGLRGAAAQVDWWRANGVYPIHFVWETGAMESIKQIVSGAGKRAPSVDTRDLWDHTTDPLIELLSRPLGGPLWASMKRSAERSSAPGGGARLVAEHLARLVEADGNRVQVHAAGHSAGSIFHAHLVRLLVDLGVTIETLQYLAPAVRVDTFLSELGAHVQARKSIKQFVMYTMARDWEQRDNCARAYRKSLLYLVSLAFEPHGKTPILGLEESVRGDATCRQLFGLNGNPSQADVIWSRSVAPSGRFASRSVSHSAFDEDQPTMNSVMRRVLGKDDVAPIVEYPAPPANRSVDDVEPIPVQLALFTRPAESASSTADDDRPVTGSGGASLNPPAPTGGRRFALCIGINDYPTAPLHGCVADAGEWARTLGKLGFPSVRQLHNGQATREAIVAELKTLVHQAKPGDVVVFQYAGHGTQLPDAGGDEDDDGQDEAMCPVDFDDGNFVIDDDLKEIFAELAPGVNFTCFFDCCHSGTITRLAVRRSGQEVGVRGKPVLARYVRPTAGQVQKHLANRKRMPARAVSRRSVGDGDMREVVLSACRPEQVAYESDGHGDFTRIATELLADGLGDDTYADFLERLVKGFGSQARQEPQLDCAPGARDWRLLHPFAPEG